MNCRKILFVCTFAVLAVSSCKDDTLPTDDHTNNHPENGSQVAVISKWEPTSLQ